MKLLNNGKLSRETSDFFNRSTEIYFKAITTNGDTQAYMKNQSGGTLLTSSVEDMKQLTTVNGLSVVHVRTQNSSFILYDSKLQLETAMQLAVEMFIL